jgi:hypothetical protein
MSEATGAVRGGPVRRACPMTRYRIDGTSASVGIPLAAYIIALGLFALWFYSLLQPQYTPNPGLAAYKPPPATVISEMPARLVAQHWQAPPLAEIESRAEEPKATVVDSQPERTIDVKEPKRPTTRPRERDNPLRDYAASHPWYSGNRPSRNYTASPAYSGNRPF